MADDLWTKDDFTIWAPGSVSILKSGQPDERKIGGFASTEALDRQNEVVIQRGLDFTEFVEHGYYNDNHRQDTAAVVGVPEMARFEAGRGWYTEGYLLKGIQKAEEIWKLAQALEKTHRKLGFSIEGKVMERRDGNKIVKAKVRHVAVTNSPVNTECTWSIIAKSFCKNPGDGDCTGTCCGPEATLKAMVGHGTAQGVQAAGVIRALVPQSLERGTTKKQRSKRANKSFGCPVCLKSFVTDTGLYGHFETKHHGEDIKYDPTEVRRSLRPLTRAEAIERILALRPNLSATTATRLVDFVLTRDSR